MSAKQEAFGSGGDVGRGVVWNVDGTGVAVGIGVGWDCSQLALVLWNVDGTGVAVVLVLLPAPAPVDVATPSISVMDW